MFLIFILDGKIQMSNSVTCLVIGDPHFQVTNAEIASELIEKVNLLVDQMNPTFVVILGDLLHTHEKIHVEPLRLATELILSLSQKTKVFLIIGNHDYCLAKNTSVMMYDKSIKLSQHVQIGDKLMGDDGTERVVTKLFHGVSELFVVQQISGGDDYIVTKNHTLSLKTIDMKTVDITVSDYLNLPKDEQNKLFGYTSYIDDHGERIDCLTEINVAIYLELSLIHI